TVARVDLRECHLSEIEIQKVAIVGVGGVLEANHALPAVVDWAKDQRGGIHVLGGVGVVDGALNHLSVSGVLSRLRGGVCVTSQARMSALPEVWFVIKTDHDGRVR